MEPPSKKQKYDQTWKDDYSKTFKSIVKSDKGPTMAFCELCMSNFSIRAAGAYDIKRHLSAQKHLTAVRGAGSSSLVSFFKPPSSEDLSVINAEVTFTKFLVEKNIPLAIADDAGDLVRAMFPKSETARKYKCARTKTTAIVHTLANQEKQDTIAKALGSGVFSLSTDGGNDIKQKLFPIIIRYPDSEKEQIVSEVLCVDTLDSITATGKDIFNYIKKNIKEAGLDFSNCISFSCDNAAVMVGETNGVAGFLHAENGKMNIVGCGCHRINLAALKGANALPHKLDQLLIDIFFFLDKSSKRVARLKELQSILGTECHEILKHVNTRWLSLGPCISRVIEQWEPLSALFLEMSEDGSSKSTQAKAQAVLKKLLSSDVKAYALFLENIVPIFETANALLQGEEPLIHKVRPVMLSILKNLYLRFLQPSSILDDLLNIDISNEQIYLPNAEMDLGFKCRRLVEKELKGENLTKFYKYVLDYFKAAVSYIQKKCNLENPALIHALVADPDRKLKATFSSIQFFLDCTPSLLPESSDERMDMLLRELRDWQSSDYPLEQEERADTYWYRLSKVKNQCGANRFNLLSRVMLGILTMFHSNAGCERLFSLVRRNKTDFRSSMSTKLVESLAICKSKWGHQSYKKPLPSELLKKAKSATAASLAKEK